jgi:opacity protein-like surface antigen
MIITMLLKRSIFTISTLISIAAIPAVCNAATAGRGRPYMSIFVGASAPQDTTATISEFNPVTTKEARMEFDPGINIGATAGYNFDFFRLEGEMSYKQNEISKVSEQAYGIKYVNVDGHVGAFAIMINGFFDLHNESPVTPYIGGGVGGASLSVSDTRGVDSNVGVLNNHIFRSDDEVVFAYQAGAGVEVDLTPHLSLDLGYRYFGTSRASLRKDWPNSTDLKLESHNAAVGLRFKF